MNLSTMAEEDFSTEEKTRQANRQMVEAIKNKSDDDFEKNLTGTI